MIVAAVAAIAFAGARGVVHGAQPPPGLEHAYAARRVALVVGIDDYKDPALGNLHFAGKDAEDLATVLRDPLHGGYDVVSVLAGDVDETSLWNAFHAVTTGIQRDDTFVLYLAAHGTLDLGPDGTELFVLPSDAWLADASHTGIRVRDLAKAVDALPARRQVMILDTCYSGGGRSVVAPNVKKKLEGMRGPLPAPAALEVSQFAADLYSASVNQPAMEDDTLANGVYTHFLIEGLEGKADANGDGLVEVMEAHAWARDRTLEYTGGAQVPWAETVAVGRESVYLAGNTALRKAAEDAIVTGLASLPAGAQLSVDGVPRGAGPIQPGERDVIIRNGDRILLDRRLRVAPGDQIDVGALVDASAGSTAWLAGAFGRADTAWMGPVGVALEVWRTPKNPTWTRPAYGLRADFGPGPFGTVGAFPVAEVTARVGEVWATSGVAIGPELGVGAIVRAPASGLQGSFAFDLGLGAHGKIGGLAVAGTLALDSFLGDQHLLVAPQLTLAIGAAKKGQSK